MQWLQRKDSDITAQNAYNRIGWGNVDLCSSGLGCVLGCTKSINRWGDGAVSVSCQGSVKLK